MTLIVGLKSNECVVIGAEQEETGGIVAKRPVGKLRLITGSEWAVVVGGAGDAAIADRAMRDLERALRREEVIDEEILLNTTDEVLDATYTRYVDKDLKSEGVSLIIGASCGDDLCLISTVKRVPQLQEYAAHAGVGADIGLYFIDRLHRADADWDYMANVAGFTLQQAIEACQYCGGEAEVYVLQRHPQPRWRCLGNVDAPMHFANAFQRGEVSGHLEQLITKSAQISLERCVGYCDEYHAPQKLEDREREIMGRNKDSEE